MSDKVHRLREHTLADIPGMLRVSAEAIERGARPKSFIAVVTEHDGEVQIYGWGKTDAVDTLATLQLAVIKHGSSML